MIPLALVAAAVILAAPVATATAPAPAPDAGQAASFTLPRAIEGLELSEGPDRYAPENLYEYINGGAEAFLQQGFQELVTATYSDGKGLEVTVDIYRHKDPFRAFAMYTQERPSRPAVLPIGVEAHAGADHLELVQGAYYAKLTQTGPGAAVLEAVARKLAALLPGGDQPPKVLQCFPAKGRRPHAEKLSARDFLGHAFLHDGAAVPYEIDGARFRLFAVAGNDAADAREMVRRLMAAAAPKGAPQGPIRDGGETVVKDPLNGEVHLHWKGRWIWGAVDDPSPHRAALLAELGQKLARL